MRSNSKTSHPSPRFFAQLTRVLGFGCLLVLPSAARGAIEIISPQGVRDRFIVEREGKSYLLVDRVEWELVTDVQDPSLSQLGDGSFHPMSPMHVRDAITSLDRAGLALRGRLLILPYPRRDNLKSSCENGVVFLSPGIREVAPEHVHATTIHELGHVLQTTLAPEGSSSWEEYLDRRGLRAAQYSPTAVHRDRPREIFAEDFRFLFGSSLATSSGSIENSELPLPTQVAGLREWFEELFRKPMSQIAPEEGQGPEAFPNPFRPFQRTTITFAMNSPAAASPAASGSAAHAVVYDLSGRIVRFVNGALLASNAQTLFQWDGRGDDGALVAAGVYFVRWAEDPTAGTARVQVLR